MKKLRVYLDTSVISHLEADDVPDKMGDTLRLWADLTQYDIVISDVTIEELDNCPEPKRSRLYEALGDIEYEETDKSTTAEQLRELYLEVGGLSPKSRLDALHIAIATLCDCDIILSWNFKHIVNYRAMTAIEAVNTREGYHQLRILSPTMLLGGDE